MTLKQKESDKDLRLNTRKLSLSMILVYFLTEWLLMKKPWTRISMMVPNKRWSTQQKIWILLSWDGQNQCWKMLCLLNRLSLKIRVSLIGWYQREPFDTKKLLIRLSMMMGWEIIHLLQFLQKNEQKWCCTTILKKTLISSTIFSRILQIILRKWAMLTFLCTLSLRFSHSLTIKSNSTKSKFFLKTNYKKILRKNLKSLEISQLDFLKENEPKYSWNWEPDQEKSKL